MERGRKGGGSKREKRRKGNLPYPLGQKDRRLRELKKKNGKGRKRKRNHTNKAEKGKIREKEMVSLA